MLQECTTFHFRATLFTPFFFAFILQPKKCLVLLVLAKTMIALVHTDAPIEHSDLESKKDNVTMPICLLLVTISSTSKASAPFASKNLLHLA